MLSKICTNKKTSLKLKELGIEGETDLYQIYDYNTQTQERENFVGTSRDPFIKRIKCYTLEQILEMLPAQIKINDIVCHLVFGKFLIEYQTYCDCDSSEYCSVEYKYETKKDIKNENFATTAARLLIKLKKDKII